MKIKYKSISIILLFLSLTLMGDNKKIDKNVNILPTSDCLLKMESGDFNVYQKIHITIINHR